MKHTANTAATLKKSQVDLGIVKPFDLLAKGDGFGKLRGKESADELLCADGCSQKLETFATHWDAAEVCEVRDIAPGEEVIFAEVQGEANCKKPGLQPSEQLV